LWELFEAGTAIPISSDLYFSFEDIDSISGTRVESIAVPTSELQSYILTNPSNIETEYYIDTIEFAGTVNNIGSNPVNDVSLLFDNRSSFSIIYGITNLDAGGVASDPMEIKDGFIVIPCAEVCTDGVDNDWNGDTDCDDSECEPTADNAALNTCDNSNETGSGSFLLNDANPTISDESGVVISFHVSLADAQNDVNPLVSPYNSSDATVYARVEIISTGCYATSTVTLNVGVKCIENCNNGIDDDGDGLTDVDDPECVNCEADAPLLQQLNKE